MLQSAVPLPPDDLNDAGRDLWRGVLEAVDLDGEAHLQSLLADACRQADRGAEARKRIADEGAFVTDRFGQTKEHPAISVERQSHIAKLRLLRECGLDIDGLHAEVRAPRRLGTTCQN